VEAISTYRDRVSHRQLGNLTEVVEQANGSREIGFHLNYAMVVIQIDGMERSEFNFLARNTTDAQFNRIYHRACTRMSGLFLSRLRNLPERASTMRESLQ
jgi:hypothetical protein